MKGYIDSATGYIGDEFLHYLFNYEKFDDQRKNYLPLYSQPKCLKIPVIINLKK